MRVLGIIPAKGTSRGIPRKNLAPLCGKPLLWWTIDSTWKASRLSDEIVSTDDDDIARQVRYSMAWNGWTPRIEMRPTELAQDDTPTIDVLRWHLNQQDVKPDAVMCLQPTCPLRRPEDIDGAIEWMERTGCDSVVSYVSVGANHPARMALVHPVTRCVLIADGYPPFARRQDLTPVYIRSGDIYLTKREVLESGSLVGKDQRAWVIPPERFCNIDESLDLVRAAAQFEWLKERESHASHIS